MYSLLKNLVPKYLKNILIFFPLLISSSELNKENIIVFVLGFISFSILTSIVYLTNDYLDFKIDKNNKLKKNINIKKNLSKNSLVLINIFFIPYFFILDFYNLFSSYLIIYLLFFYFYTFFGKKIKYLDLVLLNSFYIFRLLYGCDLFDLVISYWFIIFFSTLFLILSIFKRYIQIYINNINYSNKIIAYTSKDLKNFKFLIYINSIINIIVFVAFIYQYELNLIKVFSSETTYLNFNKSNYLIILIIYLSNMIYLTNKVFKNKINKDIFNYVVGDKFIIASSLLVILIIIIS